MKRKACICQCNILNLLNIWISRIFFQNWCVTLLRTLMALTKTFCKSFRVCIFFSNSFYLEILSNPIFFRSFSNFFKQQVFSVFYLISHFGLLAFIVHKFVSENCYIVYFHHRFWFIQRKIDGFYSPIFNISISNIGWLSSFMCI